MTPIEAMAKAYMQADDDWVVTTLESGGLKAVLDIDKKPDRILNAMRAALLALAECELPSEIFDEAMHSETDSRSSIKLEKRFKFLLRSIANEHEVSGQPTKPER